ncbi:hypothetical protein LU298_05720 [Komagataeibacter intermedius]|uniref:DUF4148 domain-containing protein n=1 Tax=Komagataeibacter intermedius AF2 TaxID=1458464 RepID=A0A0N0MFN5_9PROT|nr:hypothetical protein [Komagataeibacter intermedius]KPH87783.1 hypothetical protein GLUCOINTEAF2_0202023 [Komagataeibacter intermedius AF2]MCF3635997.1 hypothetical protein [Komagataeibacter intermedius]GAN85678.1 hypothetical protein Gain_0007_091 [Komagataeibacter intermedius TF2]
MKTILTAMAGGVLLCMAQPAFAAPAPHHHADSDSVAASDAETADLNNQSLQKARASLRQPAAPATAAAPGQPVQAAGTGQTAPVIRVPETGSTVAGY